MESTGRNRPSSSRDTSEDCVRGEDEVMYVNGMCRCRGKEGGVVGEGERSDGGFMGVESMCNLACLGGKDGDLLSTGAYDSVSTILGE